jgi:acyl-CoA synthetase (AMP-forming)/AMP-acid ligase II
MPKGVMWRHVDLFFGAMAGAGGGAAPIRTPEEIAERCLQPRTRCVPACPFMHGTAHWMAFSALFMGGSVIIPAEHRLDPIALWRLVERESASYIVIVGDAFARPLLEALDTPEGRTLDVSSLQVVVSGGAVLSPTIKRAFIERLPALLIVDGYGASETGGQGQSVVVAGGEVPSAPRFRVGDDTQVLDIDLRPAAVGVVGRLARRGHIPLGYYKDPAKSAETFPVVDGVRWAVPGDHAVVEPDGTITLLGRGSVSINTGGEKVYPEEVESVLKAHHDVFDALVVGVPDERWGERVVAVVQARPATEPTLDLLQQHCRTHLAGYKVPREVVLVGAIERSPSGKPDYRWARATATGAPGTVGA